MLMLELLLSFIYVKALLKEAFLLLKKLWGTYLEIFLSMPSCCSKCV